MNRINKVYINFLLVFCCVFAFATGIASPIPPAQHIITLDDCAADAFALAVPHSHPFEATYIGNSNSGIFHYSDCRWVSRMSNNHKVYFDSRDEAINAGYRPCKVCRP